MAKRVGIAALVGGVIGAGLSLTWSALGWSDQFVPLLIAILLVMLFTQWLLRRTMPQRAREYALRHLDPDAGPPAGAEPADVPIARRWLTAIAARDFSAAARLLTVDFRLLRPTGRPVGPRTLLRSQRLLGDGSATLGRSYADPAAADTFWLELHRPELTWWETWTLTPGHDRIRERRMIAFTHAGAGASATPSSGA
jgi:hypothetical protein